MSCACDSWVGGAGARGEDERMGEEGSSTPEDEEGGGRWELI